MTARGVQSTPGLDVGVSSVLLQGHVARELVRCAAEAGAELIVLGRQGARPLKALLIGSTAEAVFRAGQAPTLIVGRPARAAYRRPLIAVDLRAGDPELVQRTSRALGAVPLPAPV